MEDSILISTKKILGIDESYTVFDLDIITHINAALSVVYQLGVSITDFIEDDTALWSTYVIAEEQINIVKTYVFLRVRILFDPPTTSFLKDALENQLREYEWRLSALREYEEYLNDGSGDVCIDSDENIIVDGGVP